MGGFHCIYICINATQPWIITGEVKYQVREIFTMLCLWTVIFPFFLFVLCEIYRFNSTVAVSNDAGSHPSVMNKLQPIEHILT